MHCWQLVCFLTNQRAITLLHCCSANQWAITLLHCCSANQWAITLFCTVYMYKKNMLQHYLAFIALLLMELIYGLWYSHMINTVMIAHLGTNYETIQVNMLHVSKLTRVHQSVWFSKVHNCKTWRALIGMGRYSLCNIRMRCSWP